MGLFRDKIINQHHSHDHNTTVVEKRAATDESIRLLKEFEEKAENKFIERVEVKTNMFDYTLMQFAQCVDFHGYKFLYICNINGKEYKGEVKIDSFSAQNNHMEILQQAHEGIVSKLMKDIILESYEVSRKQEYNIFKKGLDK